MAIPCGRRWGGALQRSADGGKTWTRIDALPGRGLRMARHGATVYVLGAEFVAIHDAKGTRSFAHAAFTDTAVGFDEGRPYFYAATATGLLVSSDGAEWRKTDLTFNTRAVAACERRGRVAYASMRAPTGFGVVRTSDGGSTWQPVWQESRTKSPSVDDGWVSERFGPSWGEHPLALAVAPTDPERAWGTDMGRTLRTVDGGKTWTAAYSKRLADGSFTSTGLDVTTNYGIHFDPFDPARLFISYTDIGLFVSENRGQSWRSATPAASRASGSIPRTGWSSTPKCAAACGPP